MALSAGVKMHAWYGYNSDSKKMQLGSRKDAKSKALRIHPFLEKLAQWCKRDICRDTAVAAQHGVAWRSMA